MEKTFIFCFQQKTVKKFFYYSFLLFLSFSVTLSFYSCSGSKEEPNPEIQRAKDSVNVYKIFGEVFSEYQFGLEYNENQLNSETKKKFEASLKKLNKIDDELLESSRNYLWKKDFAELGTSIVQDYLTTQSDIKGKSLVFKFAKRLSVIYEEIDKYIEVENEPLPDGSELSLVKNSAVEEYITFFSDTERGRNFIDKTLYRSGKYFPLMRKILRFHGAPEELIYLSVQESGLNPTIVSRAGATGLWQFMTATGNAYGLYQDGYRDDRRDFEKSTDAAARHLKDLYKSFDDWYLAFAAYNAGPGRVLSAIRKSGSNDFWELRNYLPGETKNYVPSILALSFIFRNPEAYNFKSIEYADPISFDKVDIEGVLSFEKVAEFTGTDTETIRELNPELMNDEIPSYDAAYRLRIPHGSFSKFVKNYKNDSEFEKNGMQTPLFAGDEQHDNKQVAGVTYNVSGYDPDNLQHIGSSIGKRKVLHVFKKNDMLSVVAAAYSVRPTDIRVWNKIPYGIYPKENQELEIYISEEKYKSLYGLNDEESDEDTKNVTLSEEETTSENNSDEETTTDNTDYTEEENNQSSENYKQETSDESEYVEVEDKTSSEKKKNNSSKQIYTVKEGDYLSKIATGYGVSVNDVMEWNNLENDIILVNQKLTIYSDKTYKNTSGTKSKKTTHEVSEGEHLTMIAEQYGVKINDLMTWNNLESDVIYVGQTLSVSKSGKSPKNKTTGKKITYTVQAGNTLSFIASKYSVTVEQLKQWNNLNSDNIIVGQALKIYSNKDVKIKKTTTKKTNTKKKNTKSVDTKKTNTKKNKETRKKKVRRRKT